MAYINPQLDFTKLRAEYAASDRVLIRNFFEPHVADAIARHLYGQEWELSYRTAAGDASKPMRELELMAPAASAQLTAEINDLAKTDFQFSFYSYAATHAAAAGEQHLLARLIRFMASEDFLAPMRQLSGDATIKSLFAQATMYAPGSFLLIHNDEVEMENRRVAYVLNLTRQWRADWGGLLNFVDEDGDVTDTFFPHFNSMAVFKVPQSHFVSYVAPYAMGERCAVTGWLID
jgi:SM-20-related protein